MSTFQSVLLATTTTSQSGTMGGIPTNVLLIAVFGFFAIVIGLYMTRSKG